MTDTSAPTAPAGLSDLGMARSLVLAGLAMAVALILAWLLPDHGYYLNILMQAATYAVAAAGLVIVLGFCGQLSLAQGAFMGIGAYAVALGTTGHGVPFFLALFAGVLTAGALGLILGLTSMKLGGHYLAMVTLGFQQILGLVLNNSIEFTHGPDGISGIGRPPFFESGRSYLFLCLVILIAITLGCWRLKSLAFGRAMQAVRDNELAASTSGIAVLRIKVVAFGLSAALGGLGGGLFAGGFSYISPDQFSFNESIQLLTMALLGGIQSPIGSLLGTVLLVILPEWLRFLQHIYLVVYGGAVIVIMVFMPQGLWGLITGLLPRGLRKIEGTNQPLPLLSEKAGAPRNEAILSVSGLSKYFGGLRALDGVDVTVMRGRVHALIGPNGSGKSTFINVITGLYVPTEGEIVFQGRSITHLPPHLRARRGLCRTFQNIRVFRGMTVLENVLVGAERSGTEGRSQLVSARDRALAALDFVGLGQEASLNVSELSYGHQRHVEIARALAGGPDLLLLDEPAAGLNLSEKAELAVLLERLKGHGLTILIIDHDMRLVERVADYITVLNFGKHIAEGPARQVLVHPDVIAAYLGEPSSEAA